ncbi:MAG: hypothetical protein IJI07_09800 [Flexilinea sp.]|nr:hypothetical protein [Flexilinea sp.]
MKKILLLALCVLFFFSFSTLIVSAQDENTIKDQANLQNFPQIAKSSDVDYSTNSKSTVKKGNSGVYAYKSRGGSYSIYLIIDFDKRYVDYFIDGNGDMTCDRVKMVSGTLNDVLIITYHDGGSKWSYGLHFKWKNQPDHLILQDEDGFEWDFYTTNLTKAISLRNKRRIINY